jgi:hypothetical protein
LGKELRHLPLAPADLLGELAQKKNSERHPRGDIGQRGDWAVRARDADPCTPLEIGTKKKGA